MTPNKDKIHVPFYTEGGLRLSRRYERDRENPRYCRLCGTRIAHDVESTYCGRHVSPHARREYKARQRAAERA